MDVETNIIDLKEIIQNTLERKGILSQIKSKIRSEVFLTLEGKEIIDKNNNINETNSEIFIATELVRELLLLLDYENTLAVYCEENGPTNDIKINRELIASELGLEIHENDKNIPLIVMIVKLLKEMKNQRNR